MKGVCSGSIKDGESRESEGAIFGGGRVLSCGSAACGRQAASIRGSLADAAEQAMGRVGQAIPLPWLSQAGGQAPEVSDLFVPRKTDSGDWMEFVSMETEVARSGDWMEEGAAGAALGAGGQQQPVCDFSLGEDPPFGKPPVEPAGSASQRGLEAQVRGRVGVVGDLCGSLAVSWDELPSGELDFGGQDARVCQNAEGI